jgi:hypothetical protein
LAKDLKNKCKFDPEDVNLSYIPLTGTTFRRKTMLQNDFEVIPREFARNKIEINKN